MLDTALADTNWRVSRIKWWRFIKAEGSLLAATATASGEPLQLRLASISTLIIHQDLVY